MKPVVWGVVSTADIGMKKVNPAMLQAKGVALRGIASRDLKKAQAAAKELGIAKAYGSYEEMFADPEIEAVYNPLPNHLHVPVSIQALKAGKHVLCEKPIALTAPEAEDLVEAERASGKLIAEAFMVRWHPQWQRARALVLEGAIGDLRAIQVAFSYYNVDPANVRNMADIGGGGVYDIGCYAIISGRYLFGAEPERVVSTIERDPKFGTDRLASALLKFPGNRQLSFMVSTQLVPYQRVQAFGTKGRIEIEIPFNAPSGYGCRIFRDTGADVKGSGITVETMPACDQYTLQAEAFSRAIRKEEAWPYPIGDAVLQMRVIDAIYKSGETGKWEPV
ncbi:MAG TPA: Gfo/Idh/MocA family oxidoreductase [Candidatus Binatia bacterium]|nr:Gfo/Idh/MocA family oxidoreductase [Candidatus Binatia bacterium]